MTKFEVYFADSSKTLGDNPIAHHTDVAFLPNVGDEIAFSNDFAAPVYIVEKVSHTFLQAEQSVQVLCRLKAG